MNFKKQIFGFMDMLRFKKLVPTRRQMLAQGENKPLPQEYRTNTLAKKLHPGYMQVELVAARPLTETIRELTFKRVDSDAFPFFRAGQYVSLQMKIGDSVVSRPHLLHPPAGLGKQIGAGGRKRGLCIRIPQQIRQGGRPVCDDRALR